jgi:two-component system, OmpR family, torCAD operon response regulator TorR
MNPQDTTVLIIDDDVDLQTMMTIQLKERGFKVKSIFEGNRESASVLAQESDIILLDIDLPGANGVHIGQHLRANSETCHIPIILISSHTDAFVELSQSGANMFMRKPLLVSRVIINMNELLGSTFPLKA